MEDSGTGQDQLVNNPETEVFIQADVLFVLGIEIAGNLFPVQTIKHGSDQSSGISLSLVPWIDTNEKKIAVRGMDVFLMENVYCGGECHEAIHRFLSQMALQPQSACPKRPPEGDFRFF